MVAFCTTQPNVQSTPTGRDTQKQYPIPEKLRYYLANGRSF